MKLNKNLVALSFCAILAFSSCSSDDDAVKGFTPGEQVVSAFKKQFPNAKDVTWSQKKGYDVASFSLAAGTRTVKQLNEAWYKQNGVCSLTEIEIDDFSLLPAAVQEGYNATIFAAEGWKIDDIDLLYRIDMDPVYKIEVEKDGQEDYDLLFSETGVLISAKVDADNDNDDNEPVEVPQAILDFVSAHFGDAKILDLDYENNEVEVEILARGEEMSLYFEKATNHFIRVEIEIEDNELPAAILDVLHQDYAGWEIDDACYVAFADKSVQYKVELENERLDKESTLWFLPNGEMVK
ncbi:MAG: PepSY-like domain-containing protein [Bacteroidales bacterium]